MDLSPLRDDYRTVRRWWRESQGWSEADLEDADDGIKAAVEGEDQEVIACWAKWLAGLAKEIREYTARVRQAETRIKEKSERGGNED